ncbi:MAG: hypothetical protein K2X69_03410 [Silvanigrellaceae bacterium]|nr:hypothetical protein [Silvanigrellaceae bacterium]
MKKKMWSDYQRQQDAANQIENDIATFKNEAIVEYYKLSYDFLNYKEPKDCEIYKEEMEAFLKRAEQIEKNIIKKADERNTSISYRISDLLYELKNKFFNSYYEILRIEGRLEDCEKEKEGIFHSKKIIGNTYFC